MNILIEINAIQTIFEAGTEFVKYLRFAILTLVTIHS